MKKYWFTLYPDTFLWIKENVGFIYNANNYSKIRFLNEGQVAEITKLLLDITNLYCVEVTECLLEDEDVNAWIHKIIRFGCGSLIENMAMAQRPLSLPPILKLQDDAEYYKWEHKQNIDGNVIHNLHNLVFYINGSEYGNDLYSKQILYPIKSEQLLDREDICWFTTNSKYSSYLSEVLIVGNPFKVPYWADMICELKKTCAVTLYITIQDIAKEFSRIKELFAIVSINLLIADYTILDLLPEIDVRSDDISYTFIVTSEEEYEMASRYSEKLKKKNLNIIPVYTGLNMPFIEEYLFFNEENLKDIALSKRDIFVRQTLNVFHFGKLYIMPNGNIYSNLNGASMGTIKESPHDIVYREMTEGHSWLRIRNQKPCCDCIYQWLCPSPSNYELAIGKPNLCHVKP